LNLSINPENAPQKLLIILLGAIGDVTRALPLAMRIKTAWPKTSISWAVEPKSRDVVEEHPAIDKVIVFERSRGLAGYLDFIRAIRKESYPLVLDMQRILKSGIASRFSGSPQRIGFHPLDAKEFNWLFNNQSISRTPHLSPKIYHYQLFGDKLGIAPAPKLDFGLAPTASKSAVVTKLMEEVAAGSGIKLAPKEKRLALIMGSSWPSRFWFADRYAEVISEAANFWGMQTVLVGGNAEASFAEEVKALLPANTVIDLIGKTSLRELAAVLHQVKVAVGPDSGPMHIAAAVGTPVISLWGATSPRRSRPEGSENLVLQSSIGCSPCYRRECPGLGRLCMLDIPSEAVLARIGSILH